MAVLFQELSKQPSRVGTVSVHPRYRLRACRMCQSTRWDPDTTPQVFKNGNNRDIDPSLCSPLEQLWSTRWSRGLYSSITVYYMYLLLYVSHIYIYLSISISISISISLSIYLSIYLLSTTGYTHIYIYAYTRIDIRYPDISLFRLIHSLPWDLLVAGPFFLSGEALRETWAVGGYH